MVESILVFIKDYSGAVTTVLLCIIILLIGILSEMWLRLKNERRMRALDEFRNIVENANTPNTLDHASSTLDFYKVYAVGKGPIMYYDIITTKLSAKRYSIGMNEYKKGFVSTLKNS